MQNKDLNNYEDSKYNEKTSHAKDMTNKETSLKTQDEIAQSLINQKIESLESKQILASQLNSQIGNKEQTKYAEKRAWY